MTTNTGKTLSERIADQQAKSQPQQLPAWMSQREQASTKAIASVMKGKPAKKQEGLFSSILNSLTK